MVARKGDGEPDARRVAPLLDRVFDLFHWRARAFDRATREAFQSRLHATQMSRATSRTAN